MFWNMRATRPGFYVCVSLIGLLAVGCGSSDNREFQRGLSHEGNVAGRFAQFIKSQGHAGGDVVVLTFADAGPRVREAQNRQLRGFRSALGSSRLVEVSISEAEDSRVILMQNGHFPLDLLMETLASHPDATAVISLVGVPILDDIQSLPVPLYAYGLSHQGLAFDAIDLGWAVAALHFRGANDRPPRNPGPIPPEILDSYALETRP